MQNSKTDIAPFSTIEEAVEQLKQGKPIIVVDDENRENEGDLIALAQFCNPQTINFMIKEARGLVCTPITEQHAAALELTPMVINNTDYHGTAFTVSIDHISTTTGISAYERMDTIKSMLDPVAKATHYRKPGHVFPLIAKQGGVLERRGHTEAAIDLAVLANAAEVGIICEIINDDGTMARLDDLIIFKNKHDLALISIEMLADYLKNRAKIEG